MAKVFTTIVKRIQQIVSSGVGGITLSETERRTEGVNTNARISENRNESDQIRISPRLSDTVNHIDVYRIPAITASILDTSYHRDSIPTANIILSDTGATRRDSSTTRVEYQSAGTFTFTVPSGVTSLRLEGEGAGGGGGAATVGGGGGGGGGGNGVLPALSVTTGDTITIVVPNTAAISAVGGSCTFAKNGTNVMTVTGGQPGAAGGALNGGNGGTGGSATGTGVTSTTGATGTAGTLTNGGNGGAGAAAFGGAGGTGATTLGAATAATPPGGGGGGASAAGAGSAGARGGARITFTI